MENLLSLELINQKYLRFWLYLLFHVVTLVCLIVVGERGGGGQIPSFGGPPTLSYVLVSMGELNMPLPQSI